MDVVQRRAARVLVVDESGRVLLMRGGDPARPQDGTWWFTVGGGIDEGESERDAAVRELWEETGLRLEHVGDEVGRRTARFSFDGVRYEQSEVYFRVVVPGFDPEPAGFTDVERAAVHEHRWWSVEELRTTSDLVYPTELLAWLTG